MTTSKRTILPITMVKGTQKALVLFVSKVKLKGEKSFQIETISLSKEDTDENSGFQVSTAFKFEDS
jgi:hypothetical protein